jgi:hypothetical protein
MISQNLKLLAAALMNVLIYISKVGIALLQKLLQLAFP